MQLFHTLSDKLSEQKAAKKETKVHINNQGLTGEEYEKADKISNKPKRERTKEDNTPGENPGRSGLQTDRQIEK